MPALLRVPEPGLKILWLPKNLEEVLALFPEIEKIGQEPLSQEGGKAILSGNYLRGGDLPVGGPDWKRTERGESVYEEVKAGILGVFKKTGKAVSRRNLAELVWGLTSMAQVKEDAYNINFFYDFGQIISSHLRNVAERISSEASEVSKWRRTPVHKRDVALANRMSNAYALTQLFGTSFSEAYSDSHERLQRIYVETVKADLREAAQTGQWNPGAFIINAIIASRFIFGAELDFDAKVTFRGGNYRQLVEASRKARYNHRL